MPFDRDTRNALSRMVTACRRRLTEDVTDQLRGTFGLHPDGTVLPVDDLAHLTEEQRVSAQALRELLDHFIAAAAGNEREKRRSAYDRMVLEVSFTSLNRLAALRMCEERELVVECVRRGMGSDGFRIFESLSGGALGSRFETYRAFLFCLFDELAVELGVLFDRTAPQSQVFPSERCLEELLESLNEQALSHLWAEDETIGWVYQYFNPAEERRAMRDASQAPRNSRELAVRNQFFTPRYVVEFLTDNTLGRTWYEMRKGDTALREDCHYLVRRPNEVFLESGEAAPEGSENPQSEIGEPQSQEELLRAPVHIPHRPRKDPRDIRILDPACGSGHFLLYCFDILETVYEEAWGDRSSPASESTGRSLRADHDSLDSLRQEVPRLILEHNLHGIDIDPRAVQIAALALWLRAQRTFQKLRLRPSERPRVRKSNIVCAEPMPGEANMLRELTSQLQPQVLGQLVEVIFEKMELAGVAGSLLKTEKELRDAIDKARNQWLSLRRPEQQELFPGLKQPTQGELFDVRGVTHEEFWEQAEGRILDSLSAYAQRAQDRLAFQRKLFAEDAGQGFAFVDLCRQLYDVVLMNPPFGEPARDAKPYLQVAYPVSKNDLYASFVERGIARLSPQAVLGAITSRAGFFLSSFRKWREDTVLGEAHPIAFADLGYGVLDSAVVGTAAYTLERAQESSRYGETYFFRLLDEEDRESTLGRVVYAVLTGVASECIRSVDTESFRQVPGTPFAYWVSEGIRRLFRSLPPFKSEGRMVRQGLATADDFRFVRAWWEVPPHKVLTGTLGTTPAEFRQGTFEGKSWVPFAKGGTFSPYFTDLHLVLSWERDGRELKAWAETLPGCSHWSRRIASAEHYFKPGLTWPGRPHKRGWFSHVPKGVIFSHTGQMLLLPTEEHWPTCALLNSDPYIGLLHLLMPRGADQVGGQTLKYEVGYVASVPVPQFPPQAKQELSDAAVASHSAVRSLGEAEELSLAFRAPAAVQGEGSTIAESLSSWRGQIRQKRKDFALCQARVNDVAFMLYGIEGDDRKRIEESLQTPRGQSDAETSRTSDQVGGDGSPGEETSADTLSLLRGLLSYAVGCVFGRWDVRFASGERTATRLPDPFTPLPPCPPGMLVDNGMPRKVSPPEYPLSISTDGILLDDSDHMAQSIRTVLELFWAGGTQYVEQETCEVLGVQNLREYFSSPGRFFDDHLRLYSKSRRKAPIYWPLSTDSAHYTVWVYYHRLDEQTLYTIVNRYVEPKIEEADRGIARLREQLDGASGSNATRLRDELNGAQSFLGELRDFREELLRVASLPYKPNLDDGVIINAAPLHKLFRHRQWARDCKQVWDKLERGDYDWAHLAHTIWPDRVREVCKRDRSIAIAHGLEDVCEAPPAGTGREGRKKASKKAGRRRSEAEPEDEAMPLLAGVGTRAQTASQGQADADNEGTTGTPSSGEEWAESILSALRQSEEPMSRSQLLEATGMPSNAWNRIIRSLKDQGAVVQEGERRGATYRLPVEGRER